MTPRSNHFVRETWPGGSQGEGGYAVEVVTGDLNSEYPVEEGAGGGNEHYDAILEGLFS